MTVCIMLKPIAALQMDLKPGMIVAFDDFHLFEYTTSGHARIATEAEILAASTPDSASADSEGMAGSVANSGSSESSGGESSSGTSEEGK